MAQQQMMMSQHSAPVPLTPEHGQEKIMNQKEI